MIHIIYSPSFDIPLEEAGVEERLSCRREVRVITSLSAEDKASFAHLGCKLHTLFTSRLQDCMVILLHIRLSHAASIQTICLNPTQDSRYRSDACSVVRLGKLDVLGADATISS